MLAFAAMSIFHGPLSDADRSQSGDPGIAGWCTPSRPSRAPSRRPWSWLLVGRVLQGLAAGGSTIVSRTVIRDLFEGAQAQRLMSQVAVIFGLAPAIAPDRGWPADPGRAVADRVLVHGCPRRWSSSRSRSSSLPESHPPERRVPLRVGEIVGGLAEVDPGARLPPDRPGPARLVFGAQFLYIGGASIFVVDLLGEGELDFWKLFVPMIGAMVVGLARQRPLRPDGHQRTARLRGLRGQHSSAPSSASSSP